MIPKLARNDFVSMTDYVRYRVIRDRVFYYGVLENTCSEVHKMVYAKYFIFLIRESSPKYTLLISEKEPVDYCRDGIVDCYNCSMTDEVPVRVFGKLMFSFKSFRRISPSALTTYRILIRKVSGLLDYPYNLILDGTVHPMLAEELLKDYYGWKYKFVKHFIPKDNANIIKKLDRRWLEQELTKISKNIRVKYKGYTVEFRGLKADNFSYFATADKLKVSHDMLGSREIELKEPFIINFGTGEF